MPVHSHAGSFEQRLADALPADRVIIAPVALAQWAATTHAVRAQPRAVVRTRDRGEVMQVVRLAREFAVPVSAIGAGMNIGLGGRLSASTAPLVLDLAAHARILAHDERFGVIDLEPGVSFLDVHRFLRHRGSRFFLPAIGGPPEASVIGNLLERGDGLGPGGDRTTALVDLEAVLPTGETVSTGRAPLGARFAGRALDRVGPDIAGLFFQSAAGIVVRAALALTPLPPVMLSFLLKVAQGDELPGAIDAVGGCLRDGILAPAAASLWNGVKLAIRDGGHGDPDTWFLSGAIHAASRARAEADWADLTSRLAGAARIEIVARELDASPAGLGQFQGEPTLANLGSIRSGLPAPARAAAEPGFAWLCPTLPFDGQQVRSALRIIGDALAAAQMPPNVSMMCHSTRVIRAFVALAWDRGDAAAEARAMHCHDRLIGELSAAGFPPFRLGHLSAHWHAKAADDTPAVVDRILAALGVSPR